MQPSPQNKPDSEEIQQPPADLVILPIAGDVNPSQVMVGDKLYPQNSESVVPQSLKEDLSNNIKTDLVVGGQVGNSVPVVPQLSDIANDSMDYEQDHTIGDVNIRITGNVQKGSTLSKYTAYTIVGEDAKGKFQLLRRYSEFDALRTLLKERWPGCFIPTLPEKNLIKNSPETVAERERMLDSFLKKLAHNKHIYYGDEVQLFLRAGDTDVSAQFQKQPKLSLEEIINRYKNTFDELGGKQVNSGASIKISTFRTCLKKIQQQVPQLLEAVTNLAEAKDNLNVKLPGLTEILRSYEKNTIVEYSQGNVDNLLYCRTDNISIEQQESNLKRASKLNPFWLFSDLVKTQQKDCVAFLQSIEMIDKYNQKRLGCETEIRSLQNQIEQLALGNSTLSSITTRKSKEEVKSVLEEKNKKAIQEKHHYMELNDMVTVLLAYVEIDNYKNLKKKQYAILLKRLSGYEAFVAKTLQQLWADVFLAVDSIKTNQKGK